MGLLKDTRTPRKLPFPLFEVFLWLHRCCFYTGLPSAGNIMTTQLAVQEAVPGTPSRTPREASAHPRPKKGVLRHVEDIRQIASTATFFAVFIYAWVNFRSPLSGGPRSFLTWLSLFQLSFMGAVSTHNAIHAPLFYNSRLNALYQIALSLQYGFSVSVFIPGHNLSHHKYPQQARDFSKFHKS